MRTSSRPSGILGAALAAFLAALWQADGAGTAAAETGGGPVRIDAPFAAAPAKDLSGIACRPPAGPDGLPCLVVNDESTFAQTATLRDGRLIPGPLVPLIGSEPPGRGEAAGSAFDIGRCPGGRGKFGEFDGEGIAWSPDPSGGGSYFITGSHACGRTEPKFKASTHLLARIDVAASGEHRPAALTWRLGPALAEARRVGARYNRALDNQAEGLDIEGIAAAEGRLFFGLRSPSIDGFAHVVSASAADLFSREGRPVPTRVARLPLGKEVGIRDMARLRDGRFLLLTGPTRDKDGAFGIAVTTPSAAEEWPVRAVLEDLRSVAGSKEAKAEGLAVLEESGDTARVLVLFEDPANGGAQEHTLRLP